MKIRKIFLFGFIVAAALLVFGANSQDTYADCISSANNTFIPNSPKTAYKKFGEIDYPGSYPQHANPVWACGDSQRGIYYITGLYSTGKGYKSINNGSKYELYLNYFAPATGTIKIGMQGQIHKPAAAVYATNVRICTYNGCGSTQTDIFKYKDGWETSNSWGHYFKRTNGSWSSNFGGGFSKPIGTAQIEVKMEKYIEAYGANNLVDKGTYREGVIWVRRCYNGGGCGWSKLKFLIQADRPSITPRSTIRNKTRNGSETAYNTTQAKVSVNAHPGETVTFKHYYTNLNDWTNDSRCTTTFYNNGGTARTSAAPNFGNACKNGKASIKKVDGVNRFGNAGGDFNSNGFIIRNFRIPDDAENGAEYCEQIGYKNLTNGHGWTDNSEHKGPKVCAKVYRPSLIDSKSKTSATVNGTVYEGTSDWDSALTINNGQFVMVDSQNTSVTFNHTIRRRGVSQNFSFRPRITFSNSGGVSSGGAGNRTPTVNVNAATVNVSATTYTIKLLPEESTTVCENLQHPDKYYADTGTTSTNENSKACIKIKRKPLTCALATEYKYGILNGQNIARIGSSNASVNGVDSYKYSPTNANTLSAAANHTVSAADTWARPGDSIRFSYQGCAGAQYTVNNTSSLNNTTYKSRYYAKGERNPASNGYLFGATVPNITSATGQPRVYSNDRTWWSTGTSGFPTNNNVVLNALSPSVASITTTNRAEHSKDSYSCKNIPNASSFKENHYQITGSTSSNNCRSVDFTSKTSDVGSTITQIIQWNNLKIVNRVPNGTYAQNPQYTAKASVKIPFNYKAQPAIYSNAGAHVVYGGSKMPVSTKVYVTPRKNTAISNNDSSNTYATITKKTKISVEYFYRDLAGNEYGNTPISSGSYDGILNQTGDTKGTVNRDDKKLAEAGSDHVSFNIPVPDTLPIGTHVCARITVSPADSHDAYDAETVNGAGVNNIALKANEGNSRRVALTCNTVAKRPTFSVEGSNAFSGNAEGFVATTTPKELAAGKFIFGSWSEYGVFGKVNTQGAHAFASGATFGYQTGNTGITLNSPRLNNEVNKVATSSNTSSTCSFSTQTLANANCSSDNVGEGEVGKKTVSQFADRIKTRYTSGEITAASTSAMPESSCSTFGNSTTHCILAGGKKYAYLPNLLNNNRDSNNIIHHKVIGNAYLGSGSAANNTSRLGSQNLDDSLVDMTEVYDIKGTFVIDENIIVGDARNGSFDADPTLDRLAQARKNIIVADRVFITNKVTRIDAIIITDELNTCAYDSFSSFQNGVMTSIGTLDANHCNSSLIFNGPAITKKLTLHRTAGAGSGSNAIVRAEIFDMGMDTYLWTFNQMSRYNQAITTYTKELPSRY